MQFKKKASNNWCFLYFKNLNYYSKTKLTGLFDYYDNSTVNESENITQIIPDNISDVEETKQILKGVAVKPHDRETTKVWVRNLDKNKDWIKLKRKHWIMFLNKDYATDCFQTKDDEGNDLFLFKLKQR